MGRWFRLGEDAALFRQTLVLTLGIWMLFVYGVYAVSELVAGRTGWVADLPLDLPAVFLNALLAQALFFPARAVLDRPAAVRWATIAVFTVIFSFAQSVINMGENWLLGVIPSFAPEHHDLIRTRFSRNFINHVYMTFANGALIVFLFEARRATAQRVALAETAVRAARAETAALRFQLNPHFLFNTLNSISSLVVTRRADDAEEMLGRLAAFLRTSLADDPERRTTLGDEIETIEAYLDIERVRFGDRMRLDIVVPPDLHDAAVPGFLLQPLVENAVKYGVARADRPVDVVVSAARDGDDLVLTVFDSGAAEAHAPAPGLGVGLTNIRQRLADLHGTRGTLAVDRGDDGFTATVRLPFRTVG